MFYIYQSVFYYPGTINAPKNGALTEFYDNEKLQFQTREEAIAYLENRYGKLGNIKGNSYQKQGRYVCSHGEYSRPTYQIRKIRGAK